jgi:hypothetical protein
MRFLSADQGLEDLATFAMKISHDISLRYTIPQRRFIVVGGSYPGALSAWFREKYPHIALGALASSGVVNAILDFYEFDEQVRTSAMYSGQKCVDALVGVTQYIEDKFAQGEQKLVKAPFKAEAMPDDEFEWFLSDILVETVQYGKRKTLCDTLVTFNDDMEKIMEWLADWAPKNRAVMTDYWSKSLGETKIDFEKNGRQWNYQVCSELAYFQTPPTKNSIRPKTLTLAFWKDYCNRIFGDGVYPNTTHFNTLYGDIRTRGSRIIFTNGLEDPWQKASILPGQSNNQFITPIYIKCEGCAHCVDLHAASEDDPKVLTEAREQIRKIFAKWIDTENKELGLVSDEVEILA